MTAHDDCSHPKTKLARATCRKIQAANIVVPAGATRWVLLEITTGYPTRETRVDYDWAHRMLIGMGYTCRRMAYDSNDVETAAFFQHKVNDTMSARLELRP